MTLPSISAMPDPLSLVEVTQEPADLTETNLAAAGQLVLAMLPKDTKMKPLVAREKP